jgi:hypothetical protein
MVCNDIKYYYSGEKMRKRYRKMLIHNYSNHYSRLEKRELLKGEYVTNYRYFKSTHISKLLWGKCLVFEGIEQSGWYPHKDDLIIHTESNLSRKQIHCLNVISNSLDKELFVKFGWGPKGPGSTIASIIIGKITEEIINKLFDQILRNNKGMTVKNISIRNKNGEQYLTIIDEYENIYEFIIDKGMDDLEKNVLKTINTLNIPYRKTSIKQNELIYDSKGNKMICETLGLNIDLVI